MADEQSLGFYESALRGLLKRLPGVSATRADGWASALTGMGTVADKTTHTSPVYFSALTNEALVALFHGDQLVRKAVGKRPSGALRKGFEVEVPEEHGGVDASAAIQDAIDDLKVVERFMEACTWENLFGGCVIWMGVDDGQSGDDSQLLPVRVESLRRVMWLKVIDRRYVQPSSRLEHRDMDPSSATYGEPTHYEVNTHMGSTTITARIHRSRLIVFPGILTTAEVREQQNGWGISVLDPVYEVIQRHITAWQSAGNAVANASYVVYKLNGLATMLGAQGGEELLRKRSRAMEMAKSAINAVLIDSNDEYIREKADVGNLDKILDSFMYDVAAALETPATELFGRSPAGQNSTGESDAQMWDASLGAYRQHHIKPRATQLVELILASKEGPTKGVEPKGWQVAFPPLRELTPVQEADVRLKIATADCAYITAGVVLPHEIALSRWRKGGYSTETQIDESLRTTLAKAEVAALEAGLEMAANPTDPNAPAPGDE